MPIYEYRCDACRRRNSFLCRTYAPPERLVCAHCGGAALTRGFSPVAVHRAEADRLAEVDTGRPQDASYYSYSRNVGRWAKKRLQELGQDLGPRFDEIVANARQGKLPDLDD